MNDSCKELIRQHKLTIEWLKNNNENGRHDRNIIFREREIERLINNPF